MKIIIKDVGYNRGYVIGPYLQERPGVNADVVLEDGEDQEECALKALRYLKSITDRFHKEENPHLYQTSEGMPLAGSGSPYGLKYYMTEQLLGAVPVISKDKEKLEIAIDNATTVDELYLLTQSADQVGLTDQFNTKMNSILNRPQEFTDGLD